MQKIFYFDIGKSYTRMKIETSLELKDGKPVLSMCGDMRNHSAGQNIDSVYEEFKGKIKNEAFYRVLMGLWERNHLNDMNAGCAHQRAEKWEDRLIDPTKPKTQDNMLSWKSYEEEKQPVTVGNCRTCGKGGTIEYVSTGKYTNGLLGKPCDTCGYKYGTSWLYHKIADSDFNLLLELLEMPEEIEKQFRTAQNAIS